MTVAAVTATALFSSATEAAAGRADRLIFVSVLSPTTRVKCLELFVTNLNPDRQGMSRDESVGSADRLATSAEVATAPKRPARGVVEQEHRHRLHERADQAVKLRDRLGFGTNARLRECDRADA